MSAEQLSAEQSSAEHVSWNLIHDPKLKFSSRYLYIYAVMLKYNICFLVRCII